MVRIEVRAAHEFAEHGIRRKRVAGDQREDLLGIDADAIERVFDFGERDDLLRAQLVPHAEHRFAGVRERAVADIVQQQARTQESPLRAVIVFACEVAVVVRA
jgi:hypothetical protein